MAKFEGNQGKGGNGEKGDMSKEAVGRVKEQISEITKSGGKLTKEEYEKKTNALIKALKEFPGYEHSGKHTAELEKAAQNFLTLNKNKFQSEEWKTAMHGFCDKANTCCSTCCSCSKEAEFSQKGSSSQASGKGSQASGKGSQPSGKGENRPSSDKKGNR